MSVPSAKQHVVFCRKGELASPAARRRRAAQERTGGATEAPSLRGADVAPIGAPAPVAPTATVPSQRWLRFTQVVRKLSRLFVFIAEVLFPVPSIRRRGPE